MRCAVCGSVRLSPLAELTTDRGGPLWLTFRRKRLQPRIAFHVPFARYCLDCGALMPFVGEGALRVTGVAELPDVEDRTYRPVNDDEEEYGYDDDPG